MLLAGVHFKLTIFKINFKMYIAMQFINKKIQHCILYPIQILNKIFNEVGIKKLQKILI